MTELRALLGVTGPPSVTRFGSASARAAYAQATGCWPGEAAGLRSVRVNPTTGHVVAVYHAGEAGIDTDPATPWATVCEGHSTVVCHPTLKLAREHAADPVGWCEPCRSVFGP